MWKDLLRELDRRLPNNSRDRRLFELNPIAEQYRDQGRGQNPAPPAVPKAP